VVGFIHLESRRTIIKKTIKVFTGIFLFLNPIFAFVRQSFADVKKNVLPKNTKMADLIDADPTELDISQLPVTPIVEFDTMGQTDHTVDIEKWRLEITGEVQEDLDLTYQDLLKFPDITKTILLICPGFFALNGKWKGISMGQFLTSLKLNKNATHVRFTGPKGRLQETEIYPLDELYSNKIFLAYGVNAKPLSMKHGYPLRIVANGYSGSSWIKYVNQVRVESLSEGKKTLIWSDQY
jgi:DMSO/TMAO reductase YedYZ molybdopterin-dependent catalytic subunit